ETIETHGKVEGGEWWRVEEDWRIKSSQPLNSSTLNVGLRLREAENFLAFLELPALLQEFDALETFQDVPLRRDGAGSFETAMLRHKILRFFRGSRAGTLQRCLTFSTLDTAKI